MDVKLLEDYLSERKGKKIIIIDYLINDSLVTVVFKYDNENDIIYENIKLYSLIVFLYKKLNK